MQHLSSCAFLFFFFLFFGGGGLFISNMVFPACSFQCKRRELTLIECIWWLGTGLFNKLIRVPRWLWAECDWPHFTDEDWGTEYATNKDRTALWFQSLCSVHSAHSPEAPTFPGLPQKVHTTRARETDPPLRRWKESTLFPPLSNDVRDLPCCHF